jgi:hypothetical protein
MFADHLLILKKQSDAIIVLRCVFMQQGSKVTLYRTSLQIARRG